MVSGRRRGRGHASEEDRLRGYRGARFVYYHAVPDCCAGTEASVGARDIVVLGAQRGCPRMGDRPRRYHPHGSGSGSGFGNPCAWGAKGIAERCEELGGRNTKYPERCRVESQTASVCRRLLRRLVGGRPRKRTRVHGACPGLNRDYRSVRMLRTLRTTWIRKEAGHAIGPRIRAIRWLLPTLRPYSPHSRASVASVQPSQ